MNHDAGICSPDVMTVGHTPLRCGPAARERR